MMQEKKRLDEERRKRKEAEVAEAVRQKAEAAKHTQKENVSDDASKRFSVTNGNERKVGYLILCFSVQRDLRRHFKCRRRQPQLHVQPQHDLRKAQGKACRV